MEKQFIENALKVMKFNIEETEKDLLQFVNMREYGVANKQKPLLLTIGLQSCIALIAYEKNFSFLAHMNVYKGNCEKDSELELYDFMTGKAVYKNTCNGNKEFTIDPGKNIEKIGLYKYELKKDKNNKYYLYGYNPVNKIEK